MTIGREVQPLDRYVDQGKVLVIYGPRRVGKTFLLTEYLKTTTLKYKLASGDDIDTRRVLGSESFREIKAYLEGYELLAVDEAQNIPNIGMGLKIVVDQIPEMRVIATGSSSFEIAGQVGEPLTGRKRTLVLYPISQSEMLSLLNRYELRQSLGEFLVFGSYPEVVTAKTRAEKIAVITEIAGSYLLKDILALDRVRSERVLQDLLRLLAFQVGNETSLNELSSTLSVDVKTVRRYLDLLEKAFVIVRLGGFSKNLRNEVTGKAKYYFLDNGMRNALIASFNTVDLRNDVGALWENFVLMERLKWRAYTGAPTNRFFWRTYERQEIDLVEESEGQLHGYEFKWSIRKESPAPGLWRSTYPEAGYTVISPDNYLDFVSSAP